MKNTLVYYDCVGNIAYAFMLKSIGVLRDEEFALLKQALQEIILLFENKDGEEENNAIELVNNYVKQKLPRVVEKLNYERSQTERLQLATHLMMRENLIAILTELISIQQLNPDERLESVATLKELFSFFDTLPPKSMEPKTNVDINRQLLADLLDLKIVSENTELSPHWIEKRKKSWESHKNRLLK